VVVVVVVVGGGGVVVVVVVVGGCVVVVVVGGCVVVVVGAFVVVVVDLGGGFGDVVAVVEVEGSVVVVIDVVVVSSGKVVVVLSGKFCGGFPPNFVVSASRPPLLRNTIPPPTMSTIRASWVIKDIPLNERTGPNLRGISVTHFPVRSEEIAARSRPSSLPDQWGGSQEILSAFNTPEIRAFGHR
jgi:hypothetical protein